MKKNILAMMNGDKVEVETDGELWGFRADDIITREVIFSNLCGKRAVVEGFQHDSRLFNNKLWVTVLNKNESFSIHEPTIILLERPGLKFKVGDKVKAVGDRPKDFDGEVIVIDPTYGTWIYLVEFENWNDGHNGDNDYDKPWFPKEYKNKEIKNRWWCREEILELISSAGTEQKETSAGQTTKEPTEELRVDETKTTLSQIEQEVIDEIYHYLNCLAEENYTVRSARIAFRDLGVSLYEKITGHSERTDISFKLDGYPEIKTYNPEISEDLSEIILKMIKGSFKTPEELKKVLNEQFGREEKNE